MKNVIDFFIRHVYILVFILLQGVALTLMVNFNPFQRGVFFASSNATASHLFYLSSNISDYFALRDKNESLAGENTLLKNQIEYLKEELERSTVPQLPDSAERNPQIYTYSNAKVINKTTGNLQNYLTLNKGALDGIEPQMGVVGADGLVGQISSVSDHFSVVIPIINPKIKTSGLLKRGNYVGSLVWDGKDARFALLEGIPRHVELAVGDTLISSGYSSIFPEGILIGTVYNFQQEDAGNNYLINIKLSTNFHNLSHVDVIRYRLQAERDSLESVAR
jgi:rod shape-determining protein MreC